MMSFVHADFVEGQGWMFRCCVPCCALSIAWSFHVVKWLPMTTGLLDWAIRWLGRSYVNASWLDGSLLFLFLTRCKHVLVLCLGLWSDNDVVDAEEEGKTSWLHLLPLMPILQTAFVDIEIWQGSRPIFYGLLFLSSSLCHKFVGLLPLQPSFR